jgi:hypothetical protein
MYTYILVYIYIYIYIYIYSGVYIYIYIYWQVPALERLPLEEHGNYSSVVKKPLDLGIVCRRFRDGYYSSMWQLGDDVRLVYREREREREREAHTRTDTHT